MKTIQVFGTDRALQSGATASLAQRVAHLCYAVAPMLQREPIGVARLRALTHFVIAGA